MARDYPYIGGISDIAVLPHSFDLQGADGSSDHLFFAFAKLLSPAPPKPAPTGQEDLDRVSSIVQASPKTYANLALLGDKSFVISREGNAFIMYGMEGRCWLGMGNPVGKEEEWDELVWRFREICDRYG